MMPPIYPNQNFDPNISMGMH